MRYSRRWVIVACLCLGLCGCQRAVVPTATPPSATPTPAPLAGRITFAGSTTLQPLVNELGDAFTQVHPNVALEIAAGGSVVGIEAVHKGTVDIGMASRRLKPAEAEGIQVHPIATDVLAVVVNPANPVQTLSLEQLKAIYLGEITDWAEVGGSAGPIVVVIREKSSGTRGAFDDIVLGGADPSAPGAVTAITAGDAAHAVATRANALGYVGFGNVDANLRILPISGVLPSKETVTSGKYPLVRPLQMLTGPLTQPLAQRFVAYALSPEGQALVQASGWVPVR